MPYSIPIVRTVAWDAITGLHVAEILELCELIHRAATDSSADLAAVSGAVHIGGGHFGLPAWESHAGGAGRDLPDVAGLGQQGDRGDHAVAGEGVAAVRADRRGARPRQAVPSSTAPAAVLVVGRSPRAVLGQAQDHRHEPSGRGQPRRRARLDFDRVDGCHHDVYCLDESGALLTLDPGNWTGDKGYVGRGMVTHKKPPRGRLLDWQKTFNSAINKTRAVIEQVVSHVKNWRILPPTPAPTRHVPDNDLSRRRTPFLAEWLKTAESPGGARG